MSGPPKTLFEAVRFGTESDFNTLLKKGLGIAARDEQGRTVLHIAAEEGKTSFLRFLLKLGKLDVNSGDNYGMTPLHRAIRKERVQECKILISFKADPNATTRSEISCLEMAARCVNPEVLTTIKGEMKKMGVSGGDMGMGGGGGGAVADDGFVDQYGVVHRGSLQRFPSKRVNMNVSQDQYQQSPIPQSNSLPRMKSKRLSMRGTQGLDRSTSQRGGRGLERATSTRAPAPERVQSKKNMARVQSQRGGGMNRVASQRNTGMLERTRSQKDKRKSMGSLGSLSQQPVRRRTYEQGYDDQYGGGYDDQYGGGYGDQYGGGYEEGYGGGYGGGYDDQYGGGYEEQYGGYDEGYGGGYDEGYGGGYEEGYGGGYGGDPSPKRSEVSPRAASPKRSEGEPAATGGIDYLAIKRQQQEKFEREQLRASTNMEGKGEQEEGVLAAPPAFVEGSWDGRKSVRIQSQASVVSPRQASPSPQKQKPPPSSQSQSALSSQSSPSPDLNKHAIVMSDWEVNKGLKKKLDPELIREIQKARQEEKTNKNINVSGQGWAKKGEKDHLVSLFGEAAASEIIKSKEAVSGVPSLPLSQSPTHPSSPHHSHASPRRSSPRATSSPSPRALSPRSRSPSVPLSQASTTPASPRRSTATSLPGNSLALSVSSPSPRSASPSPSIPSASMSQNQSLLKTPPGVRSRSVSPLAHSTGDEMRGDTEAAVLKYSVLFSSVYECCERLRSGNLYDGTIIETCKKLLFAIKDVQEQIKSMPSYPYELSERSQFCAQAIREGQQKFAEVHSHLRSLVLSAKELAKEGQHGGPGRANFEVHLRGLIPSLWDLSRYSLADQLLVSSAFENGKVSKLSELATKASRDSLSWLELSNLMSCLTMSGTILVVRSLFVPGDTVAITALNSPCYRLFLALHPIIINHNAKLLGGAMVGTPPTNTWTPLLRQLIILLAESEGNSFEGNGEESVAVVMQGMREGLSGHCRAALAGLKASLEGFSKKNKERSSRGPLTALGTPAVNFWTQASRILDLFRSFDTSSLSQNMPEDVQFSLLKSLHLFSRFSMSVIDSELVQNFLKMGQNNDRKVPELMIWAPVLTVLCACIRSLANTIEGVAVGAGVGVGLFGMGGLGVGMAARWLGCLLVMVVSLMSCLFAHGYTTL